MVPLEGLQALLGDLLVTNSWRSGHPHRF